jgi:hypothetical protein
VDRAEISLIDECGHLPMIERTAEFNAQILAFLTGDPRYLDFVPTTPATAPTIEQQHTEEASADDVPPDDTVDLPGPKDLDRDSVPKVVRKQNGRYPARGRPPTPEEPVRHEAPETTRTSREPTDEDFFPELPDDLFDWPETRREFGPDKPPE